MARTTIVITVIFVAFLCFETSEAGFDFKKLKDSIKKGTDFANELLEESGEIPRENGCTIKWNIQGIVRGIEWKWICTCRDTCTGTVEVHTKSSRDGAMEHCLTALFQKLARQGL